MAAACEDDQSFPKQSPMAVYDDKNLAVTLNSYATYTAQTCPYTVEANGCACLGNNDALKYKVP